MKRMSCAVMCCDIAGLWHWVKHMLPLLLPLISLLPGSGRPRAWVWLTRGSTTEAIGICCCKAAESIITFHCTADFLFMWYNKG